MLKTLRNIVMIALMLSFGASPGVAGGGEEGCEVEGEAREELVIDGEVVCEDGGYFCQGESGCTSWICNISGAAGITCYD